MLFTSFSGSLVSRIPGAVHTYYNWKSRYGGMEASDIKKIKDLEDENRRLKQMFADLSLEKRALKDVIEKSFKTSL
ncbi:hypothetical protein WQ95_26600 [Escherichia coli]|uniref:Transposase n=1 Tax=Escherichia coli TaxID=562 RepID=A0A0H0FW36_ECOLX|nr:hypothetical protein WQ95_26600 [Escherichia coli]KNF66113.1 hypothetical protein WR15_18540 [Escherichia coli]